MTLTMNCPTESCITWNLQNFKYLSFQQFNICNDFGDLSSNSGGVWSYQGKNDYISWREAKTYHIPSFTWRWVTVKKIIIIISEEGWKNIQQGVLQQEIFSKSCNGTLTYTEPFWDFSFFAFFFFFFFSILFSVIGNPTTQKSIYVTLPHFPFFLGRTYSFS